ncbi:acetyl-CoA carboxylase biotin carboxylase subunit [Paralcaligenes sp. KSB-10]|uniref:acetyl/propionyl/methylcrotonyl-CoA carboxylase subunit alpha n=1 Tax=Paralcaligenes sp. KSB-10 TaxID=2901142 RepID=UPI001E64E1D7|nr:acetyl-CoA carboxylase biotin carboxylase subunit [Paralcaligenes sp. KSB-10]UHL64222.1 acetyl-CoA carboxylase biotin carboxylase subunit [Paralcaligenes sp. KSB-10]
MTTISKLLVANRGEIAMRILRTARSMGIPTVAIYSEADSGSPYVEFADQAVCVGAALPAESYLNINAIIEAAYLSGANAVHPGYGFLSENAEFAHACREAGLIFVGPSEQAIRAMGDKAEAKLLMKKAGLPCIPGYDGEDQNPSTLKRKAQELGYPVMIKATAGGGGRGMRIVHSAAAFDAALASAQSEARNAFGSDIVILERVVTNPRHIEIQVLIDKYGNGVHLGERDCSVQRRYQKVIEEAPAPGLDPDLRERMGAASVAAAVQAGYLGAGTFEFLVDDSGKYYFMEMNTRLQVEHPVTEAITELDLVEWQLRVAMDEELSFQQADIELQGHAIEARLCAEDEAQGYMPQSGRIDIWSPSPSVRVEHSLKSGMDVSPYYDSMMAKLIAFGASREDARRKLVAALRETIVFGIKTNQQALIRCLNDPRFIRGGVGTDFMQTESEPIEALDKDIAGLAIALAASAGSDPLTCINRGGANLYLSDEAEHVHTVHIGHDGSQGIVVTVDDKSFHLAIKQLQEGRVRFTYDRLESMAFIFSVHDRIYVHLAGQSFCFIDKTYAPATSSNNEASDSRVRAVSNGRVVNVIVKVADTVRQGDALLTVEAMKMEYTYVAPVNGHVEHVHVKVGQAVSSGNLLLELMV